MKELQFNLTKCPFTKSAHPGGSPGFNFTFYTSTAHGELLQSQERSILLLPNTHRKENLPTPRLLPSSAPFPSVTGTLRYRPAHSPG